MKKRHAGIVLVFVCALPFAGCGAGASDASDAAHPAPALNPLPLTVNYEL
jgi:hypothetical protein